MSTPIDIHGFKVYGTDVNHGLDYLKSLRPKEAGDMFRDAKSSVNQDHHFEARLGGVNQHYVLIHRDDGYELKYKP